MGAILVGLKTLPATQTETGVLAKSPAPTVAHKLPDTSRTPASVSAPQAKAPAKRPADWENFKQRYGSELQASFLPSGRLASIQGSPARGKKGASDFRSDDAKLVIARAQEILDAAHDLLGIKNDQPLESPVYRGNEFTAQVVYREAIRGIPLAPFGTVTIAMDSEGELTSLASDYLPELNIPNLADPPQNMEAARDRAIASVGDSSESVRTGGGGMIIWVGSRTPGQSDGEVAPARLARDYFVQGREVIVDASSGEVIYKKDRRVF